MAAKERERAAKRAVKPKERPARRREPELAAELSFAKADQVHAMVAAEFASRLAAGVFDAFQCKIHAIQASGCRGGCQGNCWGSCQGTCSSCKGDCAGACGGDCSGSSKTGSGLTMVDVYQDVLKQYLRATTQTVGSVLGEFGFPR